MATFSLNSWLRRRACITVQLTACHFSDATLEDIGISRIEAEHWEISFGAETATGTESDCKIQNSGGARRRLRNCRAPAF
jgi:hypothetical protein